jgi:hypothetical protein
MKSTTQDDIEDEYFSSAAEEGYLSPSSSSQRRRRLFLKRPSPAVFDNSPSALSPPTSDSNPVSSSLQSEDAAGGEEQEYDEDDLAVIPRLLSEEEKARDRLAQQHVCDSYFDSVTPSASSTTLLNFPFTLPQTDFEYNRFAAQLKRLLAHTKLLFLIYKTSISSSRSSTARSKYLDKAIYKITAEDRIELIEFQDRPTVDGTLIYLRGDLEEYTHEAYSLV